MNYTGAMSLPGWNHGQADCLLNRGRQLKKYLVRTDNLASGEDPQPYDQGLFTICAVSTTAAAGTKAGDLLVEYEIEFWNPKVNPNFASPVGLFSNMTAPSASSFAAAPLQGYAAGKESKFSSGQEPVVNSAPMVPTITFPAPGAYDISYHIADPGSTFAIGNQYAEFKLVTPSEGLISSIFTPTVTSQAGKGATCYTKLVTLVAGAVVSLTLGSITGTAAVVTSLLVIAPEAANYMLELFGAGPVDPVVNQECYDNLERRYPHHPLLPKFKSMIRDSPERHREQRIVRELIDESFAKLTRDEIILLLENRGHTEERKVEIPSMEVHSEQLRVENSDSDVEIPRSRSQEPKEKKPKKSDLKNRKI